MRKLLPVLMVLFGAIAAHTLTAQSITEFPLPTANSNPNAIVAGPDGALWFTEIGKIGRITTDGTITEFPAGSGLGIAAGPDGALWFTEPNANRIGRITAAGVITEFTIPATGSIPHGIAAGPDGNLWFIEYHGNKIGQITTAGIITEFMIPTADSFPYIIAAGSDGNLWFTEFGGNKIGRITTAGVITEFTIPTAGTFPFGIAAGPDSNLWFTESSLGNRIGRITTAGTITEFPVLSGSGGGITAGPDGALWFTGPIANQIGRITTAGVVTEFTIPTTRSNPYLIAAGPDGNLWFTEVDGNNIGRITFGPCITGENNLCLGGGRFRVQADWRVPSQGTSGHGTAVPLTEDTGYFWFFSASNVEMVVKVLDACSLNAHKWVFAGGLTNVEVTLTVTDTQTGAVRTYVNPANTAFLPIQDTAAFGVCP